MDKEKKAKKIDGFVKRRKRLLIALALVIALASAACICMEIFNGDRSVEFHEVKDSKLPADITSNVIPQYRTLERALACAVDGEVYVIVTRGEKPSSGFAVSVSKMKLEEKNGKKNLVVYALFEDPSKKTAISQIITYPTQVVKTDLTSLPDTIELRIQY